MEQVKQIKMNKKKTVFWQSFILLLLVFVALSSWTPSGNPLNPENGIGGWIEIGFIVFAFLLLLIFWNLKPIINGSRTPTFVVLSVFTIWAFITSFWAPNFIVAVGKAGSLLIITILMAAIAYQVVLYELSIVRILFFSLLALIIFLFIINLITYKIFIPIDYSVARPRFTLAFNHPNITSVNFSLLILCCVIFLVNNKKLHTFFIYGALLIVFAIFLFLTDSRTSMASVFLASIYLLSLKLKSLRLRIIFYSGIILFVMVIILLYISDSLNFIISYFPEQFAEFISLNGRISLWNSILQESSQNLIGGNGYYSTRFLLLSKINWGYHAHNSYLEVLTSTGIIGLLLIFLFYTSTFSVFFKSKLFPLASTLIIYSALESLSETKLFIPSIIMCVTCLLIFFHQQFQKKPYFSDTN